MPDARAHKKQYEHNKKLLQSQDFQDEENCDWAVTIVFYSAMHLLEEFFANKGIHNKSHQTRNQFVASEAFLKNNQIAAKYNLLYNQSIRSRYGCTKITSEDLQLVKDTLLFIENKLTT